MKDQQSDKFAALASNLTEIFLDRNNANFRMYFNKAAQQALDTVSNEEDAHFLARVKRFFGRDALDSMADCIDLNMNGLDGVITHGDAWQNNLMFKNDKNGIPMEISMLDWQVSRIASPLLDVMYFIFSCTTKELRDAHYDDFLKTYHHTLSAHIRRLGSDPDKLFPFALMQKHLQKVGCFGLLMAINVLPIITADSGNVVDMDDIMDKFNNGEEFDSNVFISQNSQTRFTKRLRDVVIDMIRLNYI